MTDLSKLKKYAKKIGKGLLLLNPIGAAYLGYKIGKKGGNKLNMMSYKRNIKPYIASTKNSLPENSVYMTDDAFKKLGRKFKKTQKDILVHSLNNKGLEDTLRVSRIQKNPQAGLIHADPVISYLERTGAHINKNKLRNLLAEYKLGDNNLDKVITILENNNYIMPEAGNPGFYKIKKDNSLSGEESHLFTGHNLLTKSRIKEQKDSKYCRIIDYNNPNGPEYVGIWSNNEKVLTNPENTLSGSMVKLNPKIYKYKARTPKNTNSGGPATIIIPDDVEIKKKWGTEKVPVKTKKGYTNLPVVVSAGVQEPVLTNNEVRIGHDDVKIKGVYPSFALA